MLKRCKFCDTIIANNEEMCKLCALLESETEDIILENGEEPEWLEQ